MNYSDSGWGQAADSCQHNELMSGTMCGAFPDQDGTLRFSRRTLLHSISQSVSHVLTYVIPEVCTQLVQCNVYIYEFCQLSVKCLETIFLIPSCMLTCTCVKCACACPHTVPRTIQEAETGRAFNPTEENSTCT